MDWRAWISWGQRAVQENPKMSKSKPTQIVRTDIYLLLVEVKQKPIPQNELQLYLLG